MLAFTKEQALFASAQLVSGLARFAECFVEEGAGARLLGVEKLEPPFEFFRIDSETQPHADAASFDQFEFTKTVSLLYDFAAHGFARDSAEINSVLSDGMPFWEVFEHGGHFVDNMGQELVGSKYIFVLDTVFKAANARASIIGEDPFPPDRIPLEHLAALSGVSVKTLRNAAAQSGKGQLKTVRDGARTMVEPGDALQWLRTRPNFKESRIGNSPTMESYTSVAQLGLHLATVTQRKGSSLKQVCAKAKLKKEQEADLGRLIGGDQDAPFADLNAKVLLEVGAALGFDDPKAFAIEAVRVVAGYNAVLSAQAELNSSTAVEEV